MCIKDKLMSDIFYNYDLDVIERDNPTNHHAMTNEHEEILGQFLDITGISPDMLKVILINGYVANLIN